MKKEFFKCLIILSLLSNAAFSDMVQQVQNGANNRVEITQEGSSSYAFQLQEGNNNNLLLTQGEFDYAEQRQFGDNNEANGEQYKWGNMLHQEQSGNNNYLSAKQYGSLGGCKQMNYK